MNLLIEFNVQVVLRSFASALHRDVIDGFKFVYLFQLINSFFRSLVITDIEVEEKFKLLGASKQMKNTQFHEHR